MVMQRDGCALDQMRAAVASHLLCALATLFDHADDDQPPIEPAPDYDWTDTAGRILTGGDIVKFADFRTPD